jgi:hypothetical protein
MSKSGLPLNEFDTLSSAMNFAKLVGTFVTIKGPEYEICGVFGVDSVEDRLLPNGNDYEWKKRRKT